MFSINNKTYTLEILFNKITPDDDSIAYKTNPSIKDYLKKTLIITKDSLIDVLTEYNDICVTLELVCVFGIPVTTKTATTEDGEYHKFKKSFKVKNIHINSSLSSLNTFVNDNHEKLMRDFLEYRVLSSPNGTELRKIKYLKVAIHLMDSEDDDHHPQSEEEEEGSEGEGGLKNKY